MAETLELLWGTVLYRPYVYVFFVVYALLGIPHLGWRRWLTFTVSTYLIAFCAEYSSTRNGFPFGPYTYVDVTRGRELWISNVPFWDSLSFVFLSYFSFALAATCLMPRIDAPFHARLHRGLLSPLAPILGAVLMTILDVVIDPITLRGDRWFLGQVYYYPEEGLYFGVTVANFGGWFLVGLASQWWFQLCVRRFAWCKTPWRVVTPRWIWMVYLVYAGVLLFMLAVTLAVGEELLIFFSSLWTAATLGALGTFVRAKVGVA